MLLESRDQREHVEAALGRTFDWEEIDDYPRLTGTEPVDKALPYRATEVLLKQHLIRPEHEEGRDAVVKDLEAVIVATPRSLAHDGCSEWLERAQAGARAEDL